MYSLVLHVHNCMMMMMMMIAMLHLYHCDQKVWLMVLPNAIQWKGRDLQYGKRHVEP